MHNRLKKSPPGWINEHTNIVQKIKSQVKCLSCLHISDVFAFKIAEIDVSNLGYSGILKQKKDKKE